MKSVIEGLLIPSLLGLLVGAAQASPIILYGDTDGVYSPSHPHLYPLPEVTVEYEYVPEGNSESDKGSS